MLQFQLGMEAIFENRTISTTHLGFPDMRQFFMSRNPGALGAMLGRYEEFELPTPVFLDTLRTGLVREDTNALEFRYGSIADFVGAQNVLVFYEREGWPMIKIRGNYFPNTNVYLDMAFLKNSRTAWISNISSDGLVLDYWKKYELGKLTDEEEGLRLEENGVYRQHLNVPVVARKFSRYPNLAKVMRELQTREKDPLTKELEGIVAEWEGNWSVYSDDPPSLMQRQVMELYRVFQFFAEIHCFVPTINQMVDETKRLIPSVEEAYVIARDKFLLDS